MDFAGRVLKLEMQIEKGTQFITMDDVQNLMDLYTQAVEYYNSSYEMNRQKYYESKLVKLLDQPNVKKLYSQKERKDSVEYENDEFGVKIYDRSVTSPFNQLKSKTKTMNEAVQQSEKRKSKFEMQETLHQKN